MVAPVEVKDIFNTYAGEIDNSLRELFSTLPPLEMYKHLAYFMGFRDENLEIVQDYGGKRFRSSLCLMLGDWYGVREASQKVALSIELFHNFTLIHDDIVDEDTFRRGRPTVWSLWGVPHAINGGDAQLLLAQSILSDAAHVHVEMSAAQRFVSKQYLQVIEGQYLDFVLTDAKLGDEGVCEEAYFDMITRKTADLITASTQAPGILASVSSAEQDALHEYGYSLGVAYQMCDDLVSIWGKKETTGKRLYNDILERKKTLPILYAYRKLDQKNKEILVSLYGQSSKMKEADALQIIELLENVGTYEYMRDLVNTYAERAKSAVNQLSLTSEQKETLKTIVDVLLPDIKNA